LVPEKRFLVSDLLDVIHPYQPGPRLRPLKRLSIGDSLRRDESVESPAHAQLAGQCPRIKALDTGNAVLGKVIRQWRICPPIADDGREFADGKSRHVRTPGFHVLPVHAVVADERVGHRDDLPLVRGIG
jgi:hypothetical protein